MSLPVDLERHEIYQNAWNVNIVKIVPLKSVRSKRREIIPKLATQHYQPPNMPKSATQHYQLPNMPKSATQHYWPPNIISCPTCQNQLPNIIGCLTCAIYQNNQLNECVKMSHRASSQHHQQLNKTPLITWKEQIKELYGDVFEGIGCIKDNIVLCKLRVNATTQQLSNPDDSRHQVRNSQGWWTVTVEAHCDNRMARMNQRSPKRSTTILDVQRRTDSRKWSTSEVNINYHPKTDERQVHEWAAHRTPWSH